MGTISSSSFLAQKELRSEGHACFLIQTTNPIPSPILVPQTAVDKLKQLIDRLRGNASNTNRIIAEFMDQNPDLVTYIKSAALTIGVGVIVATIIEDVITLGAGIAGWMSPALISVPASASRSAS